jgi:DNA (cytosine-5)-methyltransferase 1
MLTWRTRIPDAEANLNEIMLSFVGPRDLTEEEALPLIRKIVGRSGFVGKRPEMLVELVRRFIARFPDGNTSVMESWKDDQILDFLTGIRGIGMKSALCVMMYSLGRPRFPIDTHVGRILKRTQMLRELIMIEQNANHKVLQANAELAVPPSVRRALHAGLVSLGRQRCRPGKPLCAKCPIAAMCKYNATRLMRRASQAPYSQVDLFCGAGGFSEGFSSEGFKTVLAVDCEKTACETFRMNHPQLPEENVLCEDLARRQVKSLVKKCVQWKELLEPGTVDVLTAGIPCQGFSKAGYRSRPEIKYDPLDDPRNLLYKRVLLWIRDLQPRYVVLENVPEMRSAGNKDMRILDSICKSIRKMEYKVHHGVVNAYDHATPQIRLRLIIIASHRSVPEIKLDELERYAAKGDGVCKAFDGLPILQSSSGSWYSKVGNDVVTSHISRFTNDEDLKIFSALRPGEHYEQFITRRKDIIDDRRKSGTHAVYGTKSFSDKYHRLDAGSPARTIVAHLKKDGNGYIHPSEARSISIREALRLQGFSDDYVLCGSGAKQYTQVGNAIPPPLARDIARLIAHHLRATRKKRASRMG